jgi:hypothetical protein
MCPFCHTTEKLTEIKTTKDKAMHTGVLPASPQPKVGLGTVPVGVPCLRNLKLQQFSFLIIQTLHIDYTYTEDVHRLI